MANNFTNDPNCKALWKFDSGALTTDSISTNTLTNTGVAEDTVNHKEGTGCGDWEVTESDYMSIADASLATGFPLKSNDTTKVISLCGWIKLETLPSSAHYVIYSKYDAAGNKRSFWFSVLNTAGTSVFRLILGYNAGASAEGFSHGSSLSAATWYHYTVTYDNADKSYAIRIRDTNGNTVGTDLTGTATLDVNKLYVGTEPVRIGIANVTPYGYFDGLMDEKVVFSDIITSSEDAQIAQGVYGAGAGQIMESRTLRSLTQGRCVL